MARKTVSAVLQNLFAHWVDEDPHVELDKIELFLGEAEEDDMKALSARLSSYYYRSWFGWNEHSADFFKKLPKRIATWITEYERDMEADVNPNDAAYEVLLEVVLQLLRHETRPDILAEVVEDAGSPVSSQDAWRELAKYVAAGLKVHTRITW
jgi:hypothetical protein